MVGTPIAIGPFFGGLNTVNDPSTIDENQCSTLQNFDIDIDGSLVTRPGVQSFTAPDGAFATDAHHLLGTYVFSGETFVITSRRLGSSSTTEYLAAINTKTNVLTAIDNNSSNVKYTGAVQYLDRIWYVSEASGGPGGWWSSVAGRTRVTAMPHGVALAVYKERLFVAAADGRLYFSKVGEFDQWEASGFFDVGRGDGDPVRTMIVHQGQIIIFKANSTYVLAYDAAPESATLQKVSGEFGTESSGSVAVHEGMIYTFHHNNFYAINNWRWQRVSMQVKIFDPHDSATSPASYRNGVASVSSVGRRVILRYRSNYWVYFPDLESWATWKPDRTTITEWTWDNWIELPEIHVSGYREYWAGTYVRHTQELDNKSTPQIYRFIDGHDTTFVTGLFNAIVGSKMYDLDMPYSFKRLHWWGVDILARSNVNARVFPETYSRQITWDELAAMSRSWDQLTGEGRTWDRLADTSVFIDDSFMFGYNIGVRSFVKFIKSLRFRKALFEISATTDGPVPFRIFSAMAVVSDKQLVPRKAN